LKLNAYPLLVDLTILVWPIVVIGSVIMAIVSSIFIGLYFSAIVYHVSAQTLCFWTLFLASKLIIVALCIFGIWKLHVLMVFTFKREKSRSNIKRSY
jgi:hypothetical protein